MTETTRQTGEASADAKRVRLERLLRQRAAGASTAPTNPKSVIRRVTSEEPRPLSFGQERLWFLDQFDPGSSTYNIPTVLELSGELDRDALEWSISEIVRRHEALRTTFRLIDGQPVQLIEAPGVVPIPLFDLTAFPNAGILEADRLADAEAPAPFDLARGPLFRVALLQLPRRRAPAAVHDAPHRLRRLVARRAAAGARPRSTSAFTAGSQPRCPRCRSSTRTSPSGSASGCAATCSTAARLLARAARRRSAVAGAAHRPARPPVGPRGARGARSCCRPRWPRRPGALAGAKA